MGSRECASFRFVFFFAMTYPLLRWSEKKSILIGFDWGTSGTVYLFSKIV